MLIARLLVLVLMMISYGIVIRFRSTKYFNFFVAWAMIDPIYFLMRHFNLVPQFNYFTYSYILSFMLFPGFKQKLRIYSGIPVMLILPYFFGNIWVEQIIILIYAVLFIILIINLLHDQIITENKVEMFLVVLLLFILFQWVRLYLYYNDILLFVEIFVPLLIVTIIMTLVIIWLGPNRTFLLKGETPALEEKRIDVPIIKNETDFVYKKLTRQESKIIFLLSEGKDYSEIAGLLFIEKKTVQNHLNKIKNKLNADSVSELRTLAPKIIEELKQNNMG